MNKKLLFLLLLTTSSFALDEINHSHLNVRSLGMGNTKTLTGQYDQNLYGNPARATADKEWKVQLLNIGSQFNSTGIGNIVSAASGDLSIEKLAETAGKNSKAHIQILLPSAFFQSGRWNFGLAIKLATDVNVNLRKSYEVATESLLDSDFSFLISRSFLYQDALSFGLSTHAGYRVSVPEGYTFVDLIQGNSISPTVSGREGFRVDFDLGFTYRLPWHFFGFFIETGGSVNNLLGGQYKQFSIHPLNLALGPIYTPRNYNIGVALKKDHLSILKDFALSVEFNELGANQNGSIFRNIHIGVEALLSSIVSLRGGINQGYWAAGLGLDFWILEMDFATYGEEISLNAGGIQDRRYAFQMAFQI